MVYVSGSSSTWTVWKDHSLVWKWRFLTTSCQPVLKKTKSEKMFPRPVCNRRDHTIPKTHSWCNRPFPSCPSLCFKARLSAKPLIWTYFFHSLALIKRIFTRKVLRLASFFLEFLNSELAYYLRLTDVSRETKFNISSSPTLKFLLLVFDCRDEVAKFV